MKIRFFLAFFLLTILSCENKYEVVHFVSSPDLTEMVEVFDENSSKLNKCKNTIVVIHDAKITRHSTTFDGYRVNETFKQGKFKGCDSLDVGVDLFIGNEVGGGACEEVVYYYYWEVSELDTVTERPILENAAIAERMICGENYLKRSGSKPPPHPNE